MLLCTPLASEDDFQDAVSYFTGAFDEASFSESEFEHFSRLREHPLRLNYASRSALIASGLFTAYQVESLLDYRRRNGAVLSLAELGVVDGFNASTVKHYALFLDFGADASDIFADGDRAFPEVDSLKLRHLRRIIDADVLCGASGKIAEGKASLRWYAKLLASYRGAVGKWQVSAASRQNWAYTPATSGTASRSALPRAVVSASGASRGMASGVLCLSDTRAMPVFPLLSSSHRKKAAELSVLSGKCL